LFLTNINIDGISGLNIVHPKKSLFNILAFTAKEIFTWHFDSSLMK